MKAVVVGKNGPVIEDRPVPVPKPNEVLVKVRSAALNRLDLHVAEGMTHGKSGGLGNIIGIEWAGTVVDVGSEVPQGLKAGDAVMCSGTGGYAEFAVSDWGRVHKFPDGYDDFDSAAAMPVALQTAHEAIVGSGQFKRGQSVLVQGAGSVIGLMTTQVAKCLGASKVIGTTNDIGKSDRLRDFGLDIALDINNSAWISEVLGATDGFGVDLVIDMVAGPTVNGSLAATRVTGRIVNVGRMGGFNGAFDFDLHAMRRIQYIGASFRTRTLEEVRVVAANMRHDLWDAVASKKLYVPVSGRYELDDFAQAHEEMRGNKHFGKLVLKLS